MNKEDEAALSALEKLNKLNALTSQGIEWLLNLRMKSRLEVIPIAEPRVAVDDTVLPRGENVGLRPPLKGYNEVDPNGVEQHSPGAKLDAGKVRPSLIFNDMPRALLAVAEVGTFGANKYSDGGWQHVPNGINRYTDAMDRHRLKENTEGLYDYDSELLHAQHLAWNALARLELILRDIEAKK